MRAARFHDNEEIRIDEVDPSPVGETDVRIDVAACGICGSDLIEYQRGPLHTPEKPHPVTGASLPVPMGHEFGGTVTDVGSAVTRVDEGDRVAVHPNIPCGKCRYCEDGRYNVCPDVVAVGFQLGEGGFAESAVVPAGQVHPLPDSVPAEAAALVEPFAVGLHAVRRSGLQPGDTAAVFGCGPIGQTVVQAATATGAKRVFVSEPNDTRRGIAGSFGADVTIDPLETDAPGAISSATDGGVDVAFEFAGVEATFNAAIDSSRRGGTVTVGSMSRGPVSTDLDDIVTTERTVVGTYCYGFPPRANRTEFGAVIQSLADGDIDVDAYVTDRIALSDIVESGFEALLASDTDQVKVLVTP
ncbi:2,3-butanediol dehydrogenase [Halomarina halobia]|uniref:2,3-butanediol dehydrogenase n=1 Tax=Halomarina halobia TaxID=3033386 RepID=A0ABD6AD55_9EURY|nr:2,3-butanediol dehydrogenase [Halomarina sp. PSR21]